MEHLAHLSVYIPLIGSLFCFLLLVIKSLLNRNTSENSALFIVSSCFLLLSAVFYLNILLIAFQNLISIIILNFLCVIVVPILFCHNIYLITRKRFSILFYIIPITFFLLYSIWMIYNSDSQEGSIFVSNKKYNIINGFRLFHYLGEPGMYVSILSALFFCFLSLKSSTTFLAQFNHTPYFKGDMRWLLTSSILFATSVILYFLPNLSFILPVGIYIVTISLSFLSFFLFTSLCYNIFTENFPSSAIPYQNIETGDEKLIQIIDKVKFDKYIAEQRPHLNSHLKITDFARDIGTNRTYLSRFINENYGLNFSTYINRLRLAEIEELKSSPAYKGLPVTELIYIAGFKSYSSYQKTLENLNNETQNS